MRFSIRDMFWLTAVVALAATVWISRVEIRRRAARHAEERAQLVAKSATSLAIREARIRGLNEQIALLQHQLVVILEKQRVAEEVQRHRAGSVNSRPDNSLALPADLAVDAANEK